MFVAFSADQENCVSIEYFDGRKWKAEGPEYIDISVVSKLTQADNLALCLCLPECVFNVGRLMTGSIRLVGAKWK